MKKNKFFATFLSILILSGLILGTQAFAASTRKTIYLSDYQIWNNQPGVTRTLNYSYVYSRLYSVYPVSGGTDTFTKAQVQLQDLAGTGLTNIYTLDEASTSSTSMPIFEGKLATSSVKFVFRGNSPSYAAYADVSYDPK